MFSYCDEMQLFPSRQHRWCTSRFKVRPFNGYVSTPCFVHLGIDAGESHRAKMSTAGGREHRYILLEENINRDGCKKIIKRHGLLIPPKSGCWFCPFQRLDQWKKLRKYHPDLFCLAVDLEKKSNKKRATIGKPPFYSKGKPLSQLFNDKQSVIPGFEYLAEYPPCQCSM